MVVAGVPFTFFTRARSTTLPFVYIPFDLLKREKRRIVLRNLLVWLKAGLPDGIFSNQKSNLGLAFWYISWPFGIFHLVHLVHLVPFWYFVPRKIWQPWLKVCTYGLYLTSLRQQLFFFKNNCFFKQQLVAESLRKFGL
jgi:hypothetical protein